MMDCKKILTGLFEEIEYVKTRVPTAGTRFRLMALVADVEELTAQLQEVLQEVSKDAVIGVDDDVDFQELSEQTLEHELMPLTAELADVTQQVNDALGRLSGVLSDIASQLVRHHRDDEYERLYESEKRRYLSSGTPRRARKTFEEWKDLCYGMPTQEDVDNYRLEKVLHLFEKGVFDADVTHILRTKHYPGELDIDQLDDDHKLKKTIYKHYAAFRKLVDWKDGCLVVNAAHAGQHFYASRHEENAKAHRSAFMKYMHKIELVQQERQRLLEAEAANRDASQPQLNLFAPAKNLKVLLAEEWFEIHRTDTRYDTKWTEDFINALMRSKHQVYIATEWGKDKRQDFIRGCVLGLLREGGVIKGSMDSIARSANVCDNYRTFSKYMGQCRQEPYADWVLDYIEKSAE